MAETKTGTSDVAIGKTLHSAERLSTDLANAKTEIADVSVPTGVQLSEAELDDDGFGSRYETSVVLGRGGMGEVRVCRDRRIGREVAVKVVHQTT